MKKVNLWFGKVIKTSSPELSTQSSFAEFHRV